MSTVEDTRPSRPLGAEVATRMRLPGPPLGRPLPRRIGSLASAVSRFAAATSRPVDIRRALAGPDPHSPSGVRPPRWWTPPAPPVDAAAAPAASPETERRETAGSITQGATQGATQRETTGDTGATVPHPTWLRAARPVHTEQLGERGLPKAVRSVPDEQSWTPGGIVGSLTAQVAQVRRHEEVSAAGPAFSRGERALVAGAARAATVRRATGATTGATAQAGPAPRAPQRPGAGTSRAVTPNPAPPSPATPSPAGPASEVPPEAPTSQASGSPPSGSPPSDAPGSAGARRSPSTTPSATAPATVIGVIPPLPSWQQRGDRSRFADTHHRPSPRATFAPPGSAPAPDHLSLVAPLPDRSPVGTLARRPAPVVRRSPHLATRLAPGMMTGTSTQGILRGGTDAPSALPRIIGTSMPLPPVTAGLLAQSPAPIGVVARRTPGTPGTTPVIPSPARSTTATPRQDQSPTALATSRQATAHHSAPQQQPSDRTAPGKTASGQRTPGHGVSGQGDSTPADSTPADSTPASPRLLRSITPGTPAPGEPPEVVPGSRLTSQPGSARTTPSATSRLGGLAMPDLLSSGRRSQYGAADDVALATGFAAPEWINPATGPTTSPTPPAGSSPTASLLTASPLRDTSGPLRRSRRARHGSALRATDQAVDQAAAPRTAPALPRSGATAPSGAPRTPPGERFPDGSAPPPAPATMTSRLSPRSARPPRIRRFGAFRTSGPADQSPPDPSPPIPSSPTSSPGRAVAPARMSTWGASPVGAPLPVAPPPGRTSRRAPAVVHPSPDPATATTPVSGAPSSLLAATAHLFDAATTPAVRRLLDDRGTGPMTSPQQPPVPESAGGALEIRRRVTPGDRPGASGVEDPWPSDTGVGDRVSTPQGLPGAVLDQLVDAVVERIEQRVVDELERRGQRHSWGAF